MKFKKILLIDIDKSKLDENSWKRIDGLAGKVVHISKDSPDIKKELADTDCLLVNFGIPVTEKDIDFAPHLKYIGTLSTAYGKVDTVHAKTKKVIVSNLAGYSTESVAEFVIAAILEQIKGLEEGKRRGRSGKYDESGILAWEIKNKIFGVIGLGSIGNRVAEIAQGFGADVRYWSKNKKKDAEKRGIKYESLDSLIKKADFLSINLAQNKDTEGIFNKQMFQKIKKGAVIINTAPMELVDIDGLVQRIKKKDIIFILDHSDETREEDMKKLSKLENCIIYPPMAYITKEAAENKRRIFLENIEGFLKNKPQNVVN